MFGGRAGRGTCCRDAWSSSNSNRLPFTTVVSDKHMSRSADIYFKGYSGPLRIASLQKALSLQAPRFLEISSLNQEEKGVTQVGHCESGRGSGR